ncbi:MAG: hypothetical protein JO022_08890 [Acidobacteriaceae bacterium]|nr:hypothetical protein [Acidobacteriaceae bacterium]
MRAWYIVLHYVHDHIIYILIAGAVVVVLLLWLTLEGLRNTASKDEIFRLRQRLYQLERERNFANMISGPVVMATRWLQVGTAATTTDGGCLLLLEATSPVQKRIRVTVRVDGLPVKRNASMMVGQRLRVNGKSGIYSIEPFGAEKDQARIAVSLLSHHLAAQQQTEQEEGTAS